MKSCVSLLFFAFLASAASTEAAPFVNLDFELATTNNIRPFLPAPYPSGFGSVEDLLPGWTVRFGDRVNSSTLLNLKPIGANFVGVVSEEALGDFREFFPGGVFPDGLAGKFGLYVDALETPYVLTQRGDVPVGARLLSTHAFVAPGMRFQIRLDGVLIQEIRFETGGGGAPILIRDADISAFAGRNVELDLRYFLSGDVSEFFGPSVGVDQISFRADLGLTITTIPPPNGDPQQVTLHFTPEPQYDYYVEFRESLGPESFWQPLPGAPHNSGSVVDPAGNPQRFYRVRGVANSPGMTGVPAPST